MRQASACLALAVLGCAQVQVQTQVAPEADLSGLATYAQAPTRADRPGMLANPAILERVQREIAAGLDAKGYRAAPPERADMSVSFRLSGASRSKLGWASDPDANFMVAKEYTQLDLVIEVFDTERGSLVWQGSGEARTATGVDVEEAAVETVAAVLAELPSRPESSGASD